MLPPRDNRKKLSAKTDTIESYPIILVELKDGLQSDDFHEMSVVDINDSGMGVVCGLPLRVGQIIKFTENQMEWELPAEGVVMWTFKASEGFQAGIKFI